MPKNSNRTGREHAVGVDALRSAALLRLARLSAHGAATAHAPTLDERFAALERARDELVGLEHLADAYHARSGLELFDDTRDVVARFPVPRTWGESLAAQLALSVAARVAAGPSGAIPSAELAEHNEHITAVADAIVELRSVGGASELSEVEAAVARWAEVGEGLLMEASLQRSYRQELRALLIRFAGLRRVA